MRDLGSILPLSVEALGVAAGGQALLRDVSFSLPKGGITAVVGPNGAGKSLMLRACHGLIAPSTGRVLWRAEGGLIAGRKRHAMVFQRPVMLRRSVRANLVHAVRAAGVPEAGRRVEVALARFGFAGMASRPARLLSGGEQQRLAIARAWTLDPEVLILDEPTSQLDPGATRQIEALIVDLAAEGLTVLMATHDLAQARRIARRVLFLSRGTLAEDSPAEAFFRQPATGEGRAFLAGELLW